MISPPITNDEQPTVSIVIRCRNEARFIGLCLDRIQQQSTNSQVEVIVIDSGSSDGTTSIIRKFPAVRLVEIPPREFNYGATLNLGVELARGELIIALSAHCIPLGDSWLQKLIEPLLSSPETVATFGRQIPWPECEPVERQLLQEMFPEKSHEFQQQDVKSADPFGVLFSNANSCMRKSAILNAPFKRMSWSEDRVWASTMLRAGHRIRYVAEAPVFHSHQRTIWGYWRTGYLTGQSSAEAQAAQIHLPSCVWWGPRKLYWSWLYWIEKCREHGTDPRKAKRVAAASLLRVICVNLEPIPKLVFEGSAILA